MRFYVRRFFALLLVLTLLPFSGLRPVLAEETAELPAQEEPAVIVETEPAQTEELPSLEEVPAEAPPEESEPAADAPEETPMLEPEAEESRFSLGYAYAKGGAEIYAERACQTLLGTLERRAVVYVFAREEKSSETSDVISFAYAKDGAAATAYVRARFIDPLTQDEQTAYVSRPGAANYHNDSTLPLEELSFVPTIPVEKPESEIQEPTSEEIPKEIEPDSSTLEEQPQDAPEMTVPQEPSTEAPAESSEETQAPADIPEEPAEALQAPMEEPLPDEDGELSANVTPTDIKIYYQDAPISSLFLDLSSDAPCVLTVVVLPEGTPQSVVFSSNNAAVVSVSEDGAITPHKSGTATITAVSSNNDVYARVTVTVHRLIVSLEISGAEILRGGTSTTLSALALPFDADNRSIVWSSSDTSVATVSSSGKVSARSVSAPAPVTITAKATDGSDRSATHEITVLPGVQSVKIVNAAEDAQGMCIDLENEAPVLQLAARILPEGANPNVVWKSSNTRVATVDQNGLVTGRFPGSVTIYATAEDGTKKRDTQKVTVGHLAKEITVTGAENELRAGESLRLSAQVLPVLTTNRSVVWSVDQPNAASVSSSGKVSTRQVNEPTVVVVRATAKDGSNVFGEFSLTIIPSAATVEILDPLAQKVDELSIQYIGDGQTLALSARVVPSGAEQGVVWSSSSSKIATVDAKTGLVTIHKMGKTYITAKATDGSSRYKKIALYVREMVSDITIAAPERIAGGKTLYPSVTILPADATIRTLSWSTADTQYISINKKTGRVSTKIVSAPVSVTIRASATDGSGVYAEKTFTLMPAASYITLSSGDRPVTTSLLLDAGDPLSCTAQLTATVYPESAWAKVRYTSSNSKVASVDENGLVTALKNGRATITATTLDGTDKSMSVTVNVLTKVQSLSLTGADSIASGMRVTLTPVIEPAAASNKKLRYETSDASVVTVSSSGVVRARKLDQIRQAVITAYTTDGSELSAQFTITVTPIAKSLQLDNAGDVVNGKTIPYLLQWDEFGEPLQTPLTLNASAFPVDASQAVVWRSSNASIASVDENGVVTAHKTGTATITATTTDGTRLSAKTYVKVIIPVTSILIEGTKTLAKGKSAALKAQVFPLNASDRSVVWTSLNPDVVSVSSSGVIKALKDEGSAVLRATARDGSLIDATFTVHVAPAAREISVFYMQGTLSCETGELSSEKIPQIAPLSEGQTAQNSCFTQAQSTVNVFLNDADYLCLYAVVSPEESSQTVRFTSTNSSVAAFYELTEQERETYGYDAYLEIYRRGTTVITATATDGSGVRKSFTLNVGQKVEDIEISGDTYLISRQSVRLSASVTPKTANNTSVSWSVATTDGGDASAYASISSTGLLTAKSVDEPTEIVVTATAKDGSGVTGTYHLMIYRTAQDVPVVNATYRALVVVEPTDTSYGLLKRQSDFDGMVKMLNMQRFDGQPFASVQGLHQTSASNVLSAISRLSGETTNGDVTYFYFLGHGSSDGTIHFYDGSSISAKGLRNALDTLNGRVAVILANCFSGYYIADGVNANGISAFSLNDSTNEPPAAFCASIISTFAAGDSDVVLPLSDASFGVSANIGELRKSKFYVLTASLYNESSWFNYYFDADGIVESRSFDRFTRGVYRTGGWDQITAQNTWSGSKSLSLAQVYTQVRSYVNSFTDMQSSVQVYPSASSFVLFEH